MSNLTLPQVISIVSALSPDDQQSLYDFLSDTLPSNSRKVVRIGGTLGTSIPEEEGDPIADVLAELRRERVEHLNEEWEE